MIGTLVNVIAILIGGSLGLLFRTRIPDRMFKIVFQAIGIFTLYLGVNMALKANELLLMVFSLVVGSLIGEFLRLEDRVEYLSELLKRKIGSKDDKFSTGFVTSFMLFCLGAMTILGSMEEGMGKEPTLLLTKSMMDGFSAVALAAVMGVGVLFSVIPLLIYQGGLTLLAALFGGVIPEAIITEMAGVGGVLIIGLGISILEIKKIKVLNMLPALLVEVLLCYIFLT
ncbi:MULTISPECIES: DUF554 domain-containing protein [Labilibaculum]|uniref:DUF554 family protein n=1 Tax=Labilibaculum euxinus TaxID=2686357 RepID=A0A7M4D2A3_9BACT|nr:MULTISPECIES: DUF554 domain-containing protein [Labilibaculum]MBN2596965.1 DUF554 domain-containing protein [Marinifilaceae bacterium]MUP36782.1 DUF554 family protein [Labilibaculum euxinus]MVB05987.1 DUF554 family protein [Labilibaculum euxinus]